MGNTKLSLTEKLILVLVFVIILSGFILFKTNLPLFEKYIEEDGLVEWLTVLGLILGCGVCINRFSGLRRKKSWWFLTVTIGLALMLFFAAGEEISWGQRILGIKSSEFFEKNNAQGETNLHNLVVSGVKINRIIFSIGLISMMGIYLLIFPLVYRANQKFRSFIDRSGIPLAQLYQVLSICISFGLTELIRHGKRAELLEASIALLFFLLILYPKNKQIFNSNQLEN